MIRTVSINCLILFIDMGEDCDYLLLSLRRAIPIIFFPHSTAVYPVCVFFVFFFFLLHPSFFFFLGGEREYMKCSSTILYRIYIQSHVQCTLYTPIKIGQSAPYYLYRWETIWRFVLCWKKKHIHNTHAFDARLCSHIW